MIVGQANFLFGDMKMLMYLKIGGENIEGDTLRNYIDHVKDTKV